MERRGYEHVKQMLSLPSDVDWPAWMLTARGETAVVEVPGKGMNERIAQYYAVTKGTLPKDDAVPWCSAFACWCLEQCGLESPRSKAARSFLKWGVPVLKPRFGAIAVFSRDDPSNPNAGHVGFYAGPVDRENVWVLGGNQRNRVGYAQRRTSELLGYRWP